MPVASTGQPAVSPEPRARSRLRLPKHPPQLHEDYVVPDSLRGIDRLPAGLPAASRSAVSPMPLTLSPQPMAAEPPRTRSRSRSGFYQGVGVNNGAAASVANLQPPQHSGACAMLGAHGLSDNLRPPAGVLSPGGLRHPGPGAHRSPGSGNTKSELKCGHCYLFCLVCIPVPPPSGRFE